jgi:glycosyltransferase involved in cell wall biosynthesis
MHRDARTHTGTVVSSPLKVVQVVCTDAFAGVERYIVTLATGLAARGCEVTVLGGQGERMDKALTPTGVQWMSAPTIPAALRRLVGLRNVDVVHVHMTAAETAGVLGAVVLRAPLVTTRHFAQRRGSSAPARLLGRALAPRMAKQLAISRFVADRIEGPSVIVPPGTKNIPTESAAGNRQPVVLVAQRLEREKQTNLALDAWSHSELSARGWRMEIAGEGAQREALVAQASALGIEDSVRFLGAQTDMIAQYRRVSMLLAPRGDEPFGLSVVEAMAAELPVVAAGGGGHLETVGVCPDPALFPVGDAAQAGQLLRDLASDPNRRAHYGRALREVQLHHFSVDRQVDSTLAAYRSLQP